MTLTAGALFLYSTQGVLGIVQGCGDYVGFRVYQELLGFYAMHGSNGLRGLCVVHGYSRSKYKMQHETGVLGTIEGHNKALTQHYIIIIQGL